jgi:hypothetical protein
MVLKLPGADAAVSFYTWRSPARSGLISELKQFGNLYYVNQPGTDHAIYAGLLAGEAILTGDRTRFDQRTDPEFNLFEAPPRYAPSS